MARGYAPLDGRQQCLVADWRVCDRVIAVHYSLNLLDDGQSGKRCGSIDHLVQDAPERPDVGGRPQLAEKWHETKNEENVKIPASVAACLPASLAACQHQFWPYLHLHLLVSGAWPAGSSRCVDQGLGRHVVDRADLNVE